MTPSGRADRTLMLLVTLVGVFGVGVSIYLSAVHLMAVPLVCSASGAINCERVLSSPYGVIAGSTLPTAAAGIPWFAVSAGLAFAQVARPDSALLPKALLAWTAAGLITVVYLVFVEIVLLGAVCIWCTVAHALVVVTFLLAVSRWQSAGRIHAAD